MKKNSFFVIALIITSSLFFILARSPKHPIIILIGPPRSLSTPFLRMMDSYGGFKIFNEPSSQPFSLAYEKKKTPSASMRRWYTPHAPISFAEVKKTIFNAAKKSPVFVKEMSFAIKDFLIQNKDFIQNSQVTFIFLTRNPHHSVISSYKKLDKKTPLKEADQLFSFMCGHQANYELFKLISENNIKKPLLIHAEDLYTIPEKTAQKIFSYLHIPFKKESLKWDSLDETFTGERWHETKLKELFQLWHGIALKSDSFAQPTDYKIDSLRNPTFSEIENTEHRAIIKRAYKENKKYYDLLIQESEQ